MNHQSMKLGSQLITANFIQISQGPKSEWHVSSLILQKPISKELSDNHDPGLVFFPRRIAAAKPLFDPVLIRWL